MLLPSRRPRLDFERMEAFATEPTLWKTCHIARARCTCYQSGRYRSLYGRLIWRHHFLRKLARLSGGSKSVFAISSHDASSYSVTTIKSFSPLAITSRAERKAYALCIGNHLAVHIWCCDANVRPLRRKTSQYDLLVAAARDEVPNSSQELRLSVAHSRFRSVAVGLMHCRANGGCEVVLGVSATCPFVIALTAAYVAPSSNAVASRRKE
ncbi:hypothetical protein M8818_001289 [Zalaria obscura]|uniref:Uncharacterized protein n=1 Tax=Zalaria obscura TaxID=2024903 RepID=A0ACC3SPW0_9PEZI